MYAATNQQWWRPKDAVRATQIALPKIYRPQLREDMDMAEKMKFFADPEYYERVTRAARAVDAERVAKVVAQLLEEGAEKSELPKTGGTKYDAGKPDMSLLDPLALTRVAEVLTFGAKKYDAHNWRQGFKLSRLTAAALRHIFAWIGGQDKDPETDISHLAHAMCCLMFCLNLHETKPELDDRYKPQ